MQNTPEIKLLSKEKLSHGWAKLDNVKYEYRNNGQIEIQQREVYDRGDGAVILLYNKAKKTVVLTRQLRIATWFNGNTSGMMIEACAGMLDKDNPEDCIKKEVQEETGYTIFKVEKVMENYMSPGSVTEILYFFTGQYTDDMKTGKGGGADNEQENIEVLEIPFKKSLELIKTGEIKDAKTIILLQYALINKLIEL
jgi:nudix-type nucleoside diphosphatase (YffH/AdpP family)